MFTRSAFAAVLHHHQNPEFYDEVGGIFMGRLSLTTCKGDVKLFIWHSKIQEKLHSILELQEFLNEVFVLHIFLIIKVHLYC